MTTNRQPLCRGFATFRFTPEGSMETLYAVLPDETILMADESPIGDDFGLSRKFNVTTLTMADLREMLKQGKVEFIGNYPIPKH